jgi:serine/threonine protein kinase
MNEESIFAEALEKQSVAERAAYLNEACGGNVALRAQVEELLRASDDAGSFLNHAPLSSAGAGATIAATRASGDTEKSADWTGSLPFLDPIDKPDRIGQLGHYEIIEVVGYGGMGAVLRAFDTKLSRVVAVKVMAPELAASPMAVKRFLREARNAASVHHDHVVTIHAIVDDHRPPYLVMQFVEGQTLAQKIEREGALELAQILRIGSQMAAGLAAAHKLGLVHRDVKPANILLENGVERVKITDFGLARAADDMEVTQTGTIAGTPQYMSPEQAKGETIDMRSDLFSLGSVLYTMCTGRPAFRAETTMGVLRRVCEDVPRPIHEVNPEIPEWLSAIVLKLLAKDPNDRFQTAGEVADLLSQHLAHLQSPALVPRPATVVVPPPPVRIPAPPKEPKPPPQWTAPQYQPFQSQPHVAGGSGSGVAVVIALAALFLVLAPIVLIGIGLFVPYVMSRSARQNQNLGYPPGSVVDGLAPISELKPVELDQWGTFFDPVGNCRIERRPNMAIFHVPGAVPYDLVPGRPGGNNSPRLLADTQGDFVIQVRVFPFTKAKAGTATTGSDMGSWRSAGLVVQSGDGTVVRLERVSWGERNGGAPMAHCESWKGGTRSNDRYFSLTDDDRSTLLQIERRGGELFCRYSDDGSRWETEQMIGLTLTDRVRVGLYVVNTTPSALDPAFEDLRFQSAADSLAVGPAAELTQGPWVSLFNGKDLTGWIEADGAGGWQVGDGVLIGRGAYSYLVSERTDYRDFHLRAQVRINHGGNSGIYFRSELLADWHSRGCIGYEADINNTDPGGKTGSLRRYPQSPVLQQIDDELVPPDQWFTYEVIAVGNRISTLVNGKLAANVTDNTHVQGRLALQLIREDQTVVEFRKIEIREMAIPPPPFGEFVQLFNGQDLEGWKAHPDASGAWTVKDGMLVGRGTNHYLYTTRGDYGDFRLRAEAKINAAGDSGILVRMPAPEGEPIPESGYEVQIVGDAGHASPTASIIPHGAAVRSEGARGRGDLIKPDEWFVLEIAAIGGKLTVAIDGREVIRYRDDPPRPRGNIALQSFSDATEVSFRKIEISEALPAPSDPADALKGLRDVVAAKERSLAAVKAQHAEGRVPPLSVKDAQVEMIESQIRLAEAEGDRGAVIARLRELVATIMEQQELIQKRIDAGIEPTSALNEVAARLGDALARLAKAETANQ